MTYNAGGSNAGQRLNPVEGSGEIRQTIREVKQGKVRLSYLIQPLFSGKLTCSRKIVTM